MTNNEIRKRIKECKTDYFDAKERIKKAKDNLEKGGFLSDIYLAEIRIEEMRLHNAENYVHGYVRFLNGETA